MRLLHAKSFTLKSFFDDFPPYAILSHCWEEEEVVFADLTDLEAAKSKKGWTKIERTCAQAIKDGFEYCWIDTCCIDKSSSAELSEAINSMFVWYKDSSKCYAYLADVENRESFGSSKWFTRAWTLQELLAPSHIQTDDHTGMEFFTRDWKSLGSKGGLSTTISKITGVPKEYLERLSLTTASISMRMSWAADRQATRAEDIAYSLLGIFDVNMPLLYGEGKLKAFRRLQEEIMKISEDETLFAWESTNLNMEINSADVLASDPKDFSEARDLVPFASDDPVIPYSMTHRGLRIWLQLHASIEPPQETSCYQQWIKPLRAPVMIFLHQDLIWATLRCHLAHDYHHYVMIPLRHLAADIYIRDTSTSVALVKVTMPVVSSGRTREIYIRNSRIPTIENSIQRRYGFFVRNIPEGVEIRGVIPKQAWDPKGNILQGNRDAIGRISWHASIRITISRYKDPHDIVGYMFLGLGCKQDPTKAEPTPWCFLHDTVYEYERNDGSLEQFHDRSFARKDQPEVHTHMITSTGVSIGFGIKIILSPKTLFGQRMFVVDIELEDKSNFLKKDNTKDGLGVPTLSLQEKIKGLAHKGYPEVTITVNDQAIS